MKRVFTSTCFAMLCAAGLAAQSQTDDQRRQPDSARADEKSVTIVGCLRAGETPNTFMLANVKADESAAMPSATAAPTPPTPPNPPTPPTEPPSTPPPPPNPPTPPPTPPDPAAAAVGTSGAMSADVKLIGAPADLDLSKHVGHTVAITGSWVTAPKTAGPTGTTGSTAAAEARSFNVKSMVHKSETCK
jgi:hypothetical protein